MTAHIVDVAAKPDVVRRAVAEGRLLLRPETVARIRQADVPKGDVVAVAQVAALQAVKRTPELLPLCHPIPITHVQAEMAPAEDGLHARVTVGATYRTGVEMEALVGVTTGLLAAWDMVKAFEKDDDGQYPTTRLVDIRVASKEKAAGGTA